MSLLRALLGFLVVILLGLTGYVAYLNHQFISAPLVGSHEKQVSAETIRINPHTHLHQLASTLVEAGLWRQYYSFIVLAEMHGVRNELRYGEYRIEPGMTMIRLLNNIQTGRGQVFHRFRIREGGTMSTLLARLKQSDLLMQSAALSHVQQPPPASWLGKPASFEGLLYPDTYHFAWGVDAAYVIHTAYEAMLKRLRQAWPKREKGLPLETPYQVLIVASLVQTEAAEIKERPLVAGVIYNRLRRGMRLQIDPTVMFGLGLPYGTTLTKQHLRSQTPYNTYKIKGLPPTPIAFPTWTSIQAALHPAKTKALFYVANADGGHVFSTHYKAHQKAVAAYRAKLSRETWVAEEEAANQIFDALVKE